MSRKPEPTIPVPALLMRVWHTWTKQDDWIVEFRPYMHEAIDRILKDVPKAEDAVMVSKDRLYHWECWVSLTIQTLAMCDVGQQEQEMLARIRDQMRAVVR